MPNNTEHSAQTKRRYGVSGADLHSWMDEPWFLSGGTHRKFRHAPDIQIPKEFIDKYGEELARNIVLDHLLLDRKEGKEDGYEIYNLKPSKGTKEFLKLYWSSFEGWTIHPFNIADKSYGAFSLQFTADEGTRAVLYIANFDRDGNLTKTSTNRAKCTHCGSFHWLETDNA